MVEGPWAADSGCPPSTASDQLLRCPAMTHSSLALGLLLGQAAKPSRDRLAPSWLISSWSPCSLGRKPCLAGQAAHRSAGRRGVNAAWGARAHTVGGGASDQTGLGCLPSGPLGLLVNSSVTGSSAFHGPPLAETTLPRRKFSKLRVVWPRNSSQCPGGILRSCQSLPPSRQCLRGEGSAVLKSPAGVLGVRPRGGPQAALGAHPAGAWRPPGRRAGGEAQEPPVDCPPAHLTLRACPTVAAGPGHCPAGAPWRAESSTAPADLLLMGRDAAGRPGSADPSPA